MGVRLMVVDDHRLLAEALASALKLRGHRVLAAAAPTAGAAELVVSRAPEVCLMGTAAPDEPGAFDPIVRIRRDRPQVAVLVLGPVPNPGVSPPPSRPGRAATYGTTSASRASSGR